MVPDDITDVPFEFPSVDICNCVDCVKDVLTAEAVRVPTFLVCSVHSRKTSFQATFRPLLQRRVHPPKRFHFVEPLLRSAERSGGSERSRTSSAPTSPKSAVLTWQSLPFVVQVMCIITYFHLNTFGMLHRLRADAVGPPIRPPGRSEGPVGAKLGVRYQFSY